MEKTYKEIAREREDEEQEQSLITFAMKKFLLYRLKTTILGAQLLRTVRAHCLQLRWLLRHSKLSML